MSRTTALLAIDVQVGVVELIPDALRRQVLANIGALISKARISGAPVIYIQHDGAEGHPLQVDSPGWQIHPAVRPAEGEVINTAWTRRAGAPRVRVTT
jgi:nicotinamidase-related amidase